MRHSAHDLSMALNYVRLAFQSASPDDPERIAEAVYDIFALYPDTRVRIQLLATMLAKLMEASPNP